MKEKREKESAEVISNIPPVIPVPVSVTTVYTGYGTPVTTGVPTTAAPTVPINTAAGGVDTNMATFFQQMMTQQSQQMSTFMTTMFQNC